MAQARKRTTAKRGTSAARKPKESSSTAKRLDGIEAALRSILGGDAERFLGSNYQESEVYAGEKG